MSDGGTNTTGGEPGATRRTARWAAALRASPRITLAVALALALLLGGAGWWTYDRLTDDGPREWSRGPESPVPAALGTEAPVRPSEEVRRMDGGPSAIVGGLTLHSGTSDEGSHLTARDIRTGKTYWAYGRERSAIYGLEFSDDLAVVWWSSGPSGHALTAIDLRTGTARWRLEPPTLMDGYHHMSSQVAILDRTVYVMTEAELWALSAADGERRWRAGPPKGCEQWAAFEDLVQTRDLVTALATDCADDPAYDDDPQTARNARVGLAPDTGTVRWREPQDASLRPVLRVDDTTLLRAEDDPDRVSVIDVSGARPRIRTFPFADDHSTRGVHEGTLVAQSRAESAAVRGVSLADGEQQWIRRPARDTRFGAARVADGRVYVVEQPFQEESWPPEAGPSRLLVLDAVSGEELHTTDLPRLRLTGSGSVRQELVVGRAQDGIVTVYWSRQELINSSGTPTQMLMLAEPAA
ncbi:PQQ-binding-like beta-propeller repeat protein [Streptomyces sp. NPDC091292]|uniref:outer membrane protein assembly factor BamB family protein n=1 Tax=Streptomyces sp. NPDC091292 TaxID=3365991 RepID=UPI0037F567B1